MAVKEYTDTDFTGKPFNTFENSRRSRSPKKIVMTTSTSPATKETIGQKGMRNVFDTRHMSSHDEWVRFHDAHIGATQT